MNKKSKRKNDLRSSIILLLILLLLLISSTYAWFTANQTVTISTLDVHIEAQNGLQISTDGTTWKSIISNTDITTGAYTDNTNQVPTSMEPVSTVGKMTDGYMEMFYGSVNPDSTGTYVLTATKETDKAGTTGKYIAFDMFLKADKAVDLKMTDASNVVVKQGSTDKGIKQASRVAFCVQGNMGAEASVDEIVAMNSAVSYGETGSTVYIWEPNPNWHTDEAVAHARDYYGVTTTTNGAESDIVAYYGIKQAITDGVALKDTYTEGDNFGLVTPTYKTVSDSAGKMAETQIFSISAGVTKVRVYMWIEGQDVDCENTASGTDISFNVQFQVIEKEETPAG